MSRQLLRRVATLTVAFTALAVLSGIFQAPGGMQDIGALVGLIFGFPTAVALAFLVRKKLPRVAFATITEVVILLTILSSYEEQLRNPFIHLAVLFPAAIALAMFLPNDKSLQDPSRCSSCDYPIGESDVCTECGKPVKARRRMTTCDKSCL